MNLTQSQISANSQQIRHKKIKIELLNNDLQVIDSLEGIAVAGSVTANANNTIRRSGNLTLSVPIDKNATTFLDQVDGLTVSYQGKIWIDKRIKLYVGLEKGGQVVWNKLGVFVIDKPSRIFSSSEYSISFNIVDQMVLLTGERQGQLTGLGVEIPQFDNTENIWQFGSYEAEVEQPFSNSVVSKIAQLDFQDSLNASSHKEYVAALLNDLRTIHFYVRNNKVLELRAVTISLPDVDIVDIAYAQYTNEYMIAQIKFFVLTSDSKLYIYTTSDGSNDYASSATIDISANITLPSMICTYVSENPYCDIYINGSSGIGCCQVNCQTNAFTFFYNFYPTGVGGSIRKMRATPKALLLFGTSNPKIVGMTTTGTAQTILPMPSSFYNSRFSIDAKDFDIGENYMAVVSTSFPYLMTFQTSDGGLNYTANPLAVPFADSTENRVFFAMGENSSLFVTYSSADDYLRLYDASTTPLELGSRIDLSSIGSTSVTNATFFANNPIMASGPFYFSVFGAGNNVSAGELTYNITKSTKGERQLLYDAVDKTLRQLSIIKKYVIHPMDGDFKYVPFDIKVGTSATVWDLLSKFQEILSTWQFYFDLDGVFRIEPIPSGKKDIAYPLSADVYISDQNDYDFKSVKNQVVVYGKQNDAFAFTNDVTITSANSTMQLTFDDFKTDALTLRGGQVAFQSIGTTPDVDINTVVLNIKNNWSSQTQGRESISNYFYYINNIWFWLNGKNIYKSEDAATWTQVLAAQDSGVFVKIISDGSTYAAISTVDIYYSTNDGDTWSAATINNLPSDAQLLDADVDAANNVWRCTVTKNSISYLSSSDGQTWTYTGSLALYLKFVKLKYANGVWVGVTGAIGSSYGGIWSWDGTSWKRFPTSDVGFESLAYVNNMWFAGGSDGFYYSADGRDWTHSSQFTTSVPQSFAYGNNVYVAGVANTYSNGGSALLYSTDGMNWRRTKSLIADRINYVNFSNGYFVAFGNNEVYVSSDGIEWTCVRTSAYGSYAWIYENNVALLASPPNTNIVLWKSTNPQENVVIKGPLCSFEGENNYVSSNDLVEGEIYTLRVFDATLNSDNKVMTTRPITFELYSRLQPRACLVDDNVNSPFYINRNLPTPNYYAGESKEESGSTFGLWLQGVTTMSTLPDGALITFMVHEKNLVNPKISVYNSTGATAILTNVPLVGDRRYVYGSSTEYRYPIEEGQLYNDYSIYLIKYIASSNQFEFLGLSPSVYSLVLSGGEYDNIHADQLAYERCLWELYQHTNLQDNLTLSIVPDYALDVNTKIPYDPSKSTAQGVNMPSEQQYFLTKQISYPLGFDATPQQINAIRIYDDGGLLGGDN